MVGNRSDAEDAAQEAWIKVFFRAPDAADEGRVRGWIRAVVVRCCLDHHRRRRRTDPPSAGSPGFDAPAEALPPGRRLDLERAVQALPWELRTVVVLHDVEGLVHAEVGELLQISEQASRARLSRARRQLRRRLERR